MSTVATTPELTGTHEEAVQIRERITAQQEEDFRQRQLAKVATRHGMTVQQWLDHCDRAEDAERGHRDIASLMRQTPRYREGNAA